MDEDLRRAMSPVVPKVVRSTSHAGNIQGSASVSLKPRPAKKPVSIIKFRFAKILIALIWKVRDLDSCYISRHYIELQKRLNLTESANTQRNWDVQCSLSMLIVFTRVGLRFSFRDEYNRDSNSLGSHLCHIPPLPKSIQNSRYRSC
jgi:hypothetical protein